MRRKLTSIGLAVALALLSISQAACGNDATLARVGNVAVQLANGFEGEVNALEAAGLLKDANKLARLRQRVSQAKTSANALNTYLLGLREVNASDKAAITQKIAELAAILSGVLTSQDAFGLSEDTSVVVILRYATVSLNQLALVIAALNPPAAGIAAAGAGGGGIKVEKIKVRFSEPPTVAQKYLK